MAEQVPSTQPMDGLPDEPDEPDQSDKTDNSDERFIGPQARPQAEPRQTPWIGSAPVPAAPIPPRGAASGTVDRVRRHLRDRFDRVFPPSEPAEDVTFREHTLTMPPEELAEYLRTSGHHPQLPPYPQLELPPPPAPPGWSPPTPSWTAQPSAAPPPGWVAAGWVPAGWVAKRRKRWPWVLLGIGLVMLICCCGCPALIVKRFLDEDPAAVATPVQAAGLVWVDDTASQRLATDLRRRVQSEYQLADNVFPAVYAPAGRR